MAVETSRQAVGTERYPAEGAGYPEPRGEGWVTFAGVMLTMIGILNFIGGSAAPTPANTQAGTAPPPAGSLHTAGWEIPTNRHLAPAPAHSNSPPGPVARGGGAGLG